MKYTILVVTGTRAEYGILKPLMQKFVNDSDFQLDIIATAMHLEEKYGYTYKFIEQDGFKITKKISMNLSDTSNRTILRGMSHLQNELGDYFTENEVDLVIILGDRYEMLSVANAAVLNRVPIAHLHGGELTLGNYDEFIRHAITKMSHLHLTSTERYRQRVIQLGEQPDTVMNVGSLGVQNVVNELPTMTLEKLDFLQLHQSYSVVLFHPETLQAGKSVVEQTETLLNVLRKQKKQFIFIGSNSDTGSDEIMALIHGYIAQDTYGSQFVPSLTTEDYHSLVRFADYLIGNSSSGIIEVPSLQTITINIGDRQKGRVHGSSVIDSPINEASLEVALNKAVGLQTKDFIFENPYYQPNAVGMAYKFIVDHLSRGIPKEKLFYDIEPLGDSYDDRTLQNY